LEPCIKIVLTCLIVSHSGPASLHSSPARSYEHTRVILATSGCTSAQSIEKEPRTTFQNHGWTAISSAVHVQLATTNIH